MFHVGDEVAASVRQQAETVRNLTTRVAQEIGMVIHSNPADLTLGGLRC